MAAATATANFFLRTTTYGSGSQSHVLASEEADGDGASWYTCYMPAATTPVPGVQPQQSRLEFTVTDRQKVHDAIARRMAASTGVTTVGRRWNGGDRETPVESPSGEGSTMPRPGHIEPRAGGGHGGTHNGAVACRRCNRDKSTKTMEDWDNELRDFLEP
jgi:hypothetical protein